MTSANDASTVQSVTTSARSRPEDHARHSRKLAEDARERKWRRDSFLRDLFLGRFRIDLLDPYPIKRTPNAAFLGFRGALEQFLRERVDPAEIDATGEYPLDVVRGLADLGAFGMKIERRYGGLGFSHAEYVDIMKLVGSYDANVAALLSAHQSIGVPQPLKLFGSDAQRRKYLPRCARGSISAFALTEPAVGSDPARLATIAVLSADGHHYELSGEKLWCTNGTLAELLVVMARNPETDKINAFIVETGWKGVHVEHRCHFMGLRALANAHLRFDRVKVPVENRIGGEGDGLKIALVTLNTGRLTLPAATTGAVKRAVEVMRLWASARVQWGVAIGKHEAVAHKIADAAAHAFAMEAVADLLGDLADRPDYDLRLEAAAAKEWNTTWAWRILDDALQVRGGRGYETERSLAARGEAPTAIERMLRDARVNLIFEGSSEIMHLFMAREAVDRHLSVSGILIDPDVSVGKKLLALPKIAAFYGLWYPAQWISKAWRLRSNEFGPLTGHLRFVERSARRLARQVFHGMLVHQAALERRQAFLFRLVDVAMELFAMTATITRVKAMQRAGDPEANVAAEVARVFCASSRRRVRKLFRDLWRNDDRKRYAFAQAVLTGEHAWLQTGIVPLDLSSEDLTPASVETDLRRRGLWPATKKHAPRRPDGTEQERRDPFRPGEVVALHRG